MQAHSENFQFSDILFVKPQRYMRWIPAFKFNLKIPKHHNRNLSRNRFYLFTLKRKIYRYQPCL